MDGIKSLAQSRKFWISLVGVIVSLLAAFGLATFTDAQESQIVDVILIIVGAVAPLVSAANLTHAIAIEDAALKSTLGAEEKQG